MALLFFFLQQLNGSQCQILLLFYFILLRKHCRYGCAFHMELWMHGIHVFFFYYYYYYYKAAEGMPFLPQKY